MNLAMILMESMATRLKDAGINTLICICVVFAVLIFISLVISLFSFIPKAEAAAARKKARKIEKNLLLKLLTMRFHRLRPRKQKLVK